MPELPHHGASLHCELHGDGGEPVLFIQGVGIIGNGWKPQVNGLDASHRLLTFDNRGIGQSTLPAGEPLPIKAMAGDARALLVGAGWDSAHIVGIRWAASSRSDSRSRTRVV